MNTETSSTQSNIGLDINTNLKIQQVTNALSNRKVCILLCFNY